MASCDWCAKRCEYTPTTYRIISGGQFVFLCDRHRKVMESGNLKEDQPKQPTKEKDIW